ncbi:MAG: ribonuclease H-like domain-containing protein [Candidatus Heimdallarchaeaceae archaeon]
MWCGINDLVYDIETTGLSPEIDIITCISCTFDGNDIHSFLNDKSEKKLLVDFYSYIDKVKPDRLVGFNNYEFDDVFVFKRTIHNKIDKGFPMILPNKSIDLRPILTVFKLKAYGKDKYVKGSLDYFASMYGITKGDNTISGFDCISAFSNGNLEDIRLHCEDDVRRTYYLYKLVHKFITPI